ncbi:peptidylprolyl isomerase [Aequorivita echinoideorum]|nr:peptidylprolyl isomerase [Aequorivita echinoideorum]
MKKYSLLFLLFVTATTAGFSQSKKEVLLTIDGNPVYSNEFKRVYKKNLELVQDESQKDIDSYLQLFIDYKLKIAEAKAQGLDTEKTYVTEFSQYRDQLSRNYIFEEKVTEGLAKEAYERSLEEIKASHILIRTDYESVPQDTLAAYNKIKSIRERALKGEDFTELAKANSEEPGAKESGGNLGYFSVFTMVYPFETAAYNTKKGEISEIVRTRFGYHIIKVEDRRKKEPKISVSHIMISDNESTRTFDPKERINEIAAMLKQGESFESLAKQYSDDKNSAVKGGKLNAFSKGDLRSTEFENAAYALKNAGDLSKPVKTDFGWHIIRLDEKLPAQTYEQEREMLEKRVADGDRSKIVTNAVNKQIKEKYGFKKGQSYLPYFDTYLTDEVLKRRWTMDSIPDSENKVLFTIGDKKSDYRDFAKYIAGRQRFNKPYKMKETLLVDMYDEFETQQLKEYFKERLEVENEDYAAILNEYRDGLLIFDVMNKNIWQKAKTDSLGLEKFFQNNKNNYQWKQRVEAEIISSNSNDFAKQAKEMFSNGKTGEEVKAALNTGEKVNVILTQGTFEAGQREIPENLNMKKGVSDIYKNNDSYIVVNVKHVLPAGAKSLEDVKGKALSDYQNELEKNWMESLHNKYVVEVNKKSLKKIKKELK